ncbi:hypothetical protein NLI96_g2333 [Meripilus lineatus]|uniref:Uncharacterized protein n=1 Tax=Meripilus lineatus TaxID=2056292 RepID=A0AAD5YM08_9APHY|nr:hypothetical protein NLI96_g2333 [Physisporinus lineatus]
MKKPTSGGAMPQERVPTLQLSILGYSGANMCPRLLQPSGRPTESALLMFEDAVMSQRSNLGKGRPVPRWDPLRV